jgi:anaerobic selenocysteine-containing dehydrogenase
MTPRAIVDETLRASGWQSIAEIEAAGGLLDVQPPFRQAHYLDGFAYPDKKFRFKPDWTKVPVANDGPKGPWATMPALPDHWGAIEGATEEHPFRLATSPARNFLNSTFTETPTSRTREGRPEVMMHPSDAAALGIAAGDWVRLSNARGAVFLRARLFEGVRRGVLIAEGIWPNHAHPYGRGINTLTGADQPAPFGGAAFHDNRVALARAELPADIVAALGPAAERNLVPA